MKTIFEYIRSYIPFYQRNLKIAIPVMLSQLGQGLVQLVDTIMVGHVSRVDLAAASFGGAVFFVGFACALGFTMGSTPLIGAEYSAGNHKMVSRLFQNSILFDVLVSIVLGSIMFVVSCYMGQMGQPEEVWPLAMLYYRILLASLPFVLVFQAFRQFMEGVGNTKYAMMVTIAGNALNVFLNWILIFGKFGCDAMGVAGAAYATLISRGLMCLAFVALVVYKKSDYVSEFCWRLFDKVTFRKLLNISWPIGAQMLLETLGMNIAVMFVGWCGTVALASHQIAINISAMTWMVSCGIASATTIRVSHQIGVKDYASMRKAGIASMHLSLAFMGVCSIVAIVLQTPIARVFTNDEEVVLLASSLIAIVGIYQLADGLQTVIIGALRGMQDVITPMIVAFVCYIVVCLSVSYYCGIYLGWGAVGVWIGYVVELYLASAILWIAFNRRTHHYSTLLQKQDSLLPEEEKQ